MRREILKERLLLGMVPSNKILSNESNEVLHGLDLIF